MFSRQHASEQDWDHWPFVGGARFAASADSSAFGEKLKAAVKTRIALRSGHKIAAPSDDDSFGAKLRRAIQARLSTKQQHRQYTEREGARYKFKPRPCTKSD